MQDQPSDFQQSVVLPHLKKHPSYLSQDDHSQLIRRKSSLMHNGIERKQSLLTPAQSIKTNHFDQIKYGLHETKQQHHSLLKNFSSNHIEINKKHHKTYREALQCEDYQKNINSTVQQSSDLLARIIKTQDKVNQTISKNEKQMDYNEDKLEQIDFMKTKKQETIVQIKSLENSTKQEKIMSIQNKKLNSQLLKADLNLNAYLQALTLKLTNLNYTRNHYSDQFECKEQQQEPQ